MSTQPLLGKLINFRIITLLVAGAFLWQPKGNRAAITALKKLETSFPKVNRLALIRATKSRRYDRSWLDSCYNVESCYCEAVVSLI